MMEKEELKCKKVDFILEMLKIKDSIGSIFTALNEQFGSEHQEEHLSISSEMESYGLVRQHQYGQYKATDIGMFVLDSGGFFKYKENRRKIGSLEADLANYNIKIAKKTLNNMNKTLVIGLTGGLVGVIGGIAGLMSLYVQLTTSTPLLEQTVLNPTSKRSQQSLQHSEQILETSKTSTVDSTRSEILTKDSLK